MIRCDRHSKKRTQALVEQVLGHSSPSQCRRRIAITWSYRWPCDVFHEFTKDICGLEAAQLRNEEAVKRHLCLSCIAHSCLQNAPMGGGKSEIFSWANTTPSIGQKLYGLSREAVQAMLQLAHSQFAQGRSVEQVLKVMMPA